MGVKVEVNYPQIDLPKTKSRLNENMADFLLKTLRIWVSATVDPVPVWSGAARASFLFLAAEARTTIEINPVAPSRIFLGVTEAKAEIFSDPGKGYGWTWESTLAHIDFVDDISGFVNAGLAAIEKLEPELPQPVFKADTING